MPNWIEDAARKMKDEHERQREAEESQVLRDKAILVTGPAALAKLMETVEKDIERFNAVFPEDRKRLKNLERIGDTGFQVVRPYPPTYVLRVTLQGSLLRYNIQQQSVDGRLRSTEGAFNACIDPSSGVRLLRERSTGDTIPFGAASKELISPAIEFLDQTP